ncbi:chorismate binding enzyme [Fragilaria crotonensis]|nr:chorismate binding enzyme [Fragilaria crotonensis]
MNGAAIEIKQAKYDLQVVLIDHYDSYTYNLYDMIASLCTRPPLVLTKDFLPCDLDNPQQTDQRVPNFPPCDAIILSPGPGRPSCPQDMGYTLDWIRHATQLQLPLLGVCLGHQALAHVHGATVRECLTPVHGQVHDIQLISSSDSMLWEGIPEESIPVTRYHSLGVYDIPDALTVTAQYTDPTTGECVIMALQHKTLPQYGVQFHPESIGTPHGRTMMDNFLKSCVKRNTDTRRARMIPPPRIIEAAMYATVEATPPPQPPQVYRVSVRTLTGLGVSTSRAFEALYHQNASLPAIWLDSSLQQQQQNNTDDADNMTRYSILAGMTGPLSRRIDYYGQEHADWETRGVYVTHSDGTRERDDSVEDVLDYLERHHKGVELIYDGNDDVDAADLPFVGGHLGYLGYDVRRDTQRKLDQLENMDNVPPTRSNTPPATRTRPSTNPHVPTAAFLFCDQCLIYDHWKDTWHLIELTTPTSSPTNWISSTEQILRSLSTMSMTRTAKEPEQQPLPQSKPLVPLHFVPNRSRSAYQADIANCHEQIRLGESYELCLTNQLEATVVAPSSTMLDPFRLYKILRNRNPAPFAAYVNFQGTATTPKEGPSAKMTICCSSPERFVSVRPSTDKTNDFIVEAKPIKGTAPRYHSTNNSNNSSSSTTNHDDNTVLMDTVVALELQTSIKNRAENLMIVDLLRNDLNRVCQTGTVHVPKLMAIETYATVHQLVSTIRGVLESNKTALDVLTACFPGGSMTGAPKRRTVELLEEMEDGVSRGPYAGCLGYLSLNGRMDMNIVIRSIVVTPLTDGGGDGDDDDGWKVSIGAGGAITALSESDDEYEEMLLKARAVKEAVEIWASSPTSRDSHDGNHAPATAAESLLELNVEVPK